METLKLDQPLPVNQQPICKLIEQLQLYQVLSIADKLNLFDALQTGQTAATLFA